MTIFKKRPLPTLIRCILLCLPVLIFLAVPAHGQSASEYFKEGRQAMAARHYKIAYDTFSKAFDLEPANLEISFQLGRAAFETGDYEMAIMAFERVQIMEPDSQRVKLELARTYLALKAYQTSKQYFNDVLASNPPAAVRNNIDTYLTLIERSGQRHFISGMISSGVNWDDNIYAAPVDDIFNSITLTGNSASPEEDLITTSFVNLTHLYQAQASEFGWKTTFANYNAFYQDAHELDVNFYSVGTGPVIKGTGSLLDLHGTYSYMDYEHDRYFQSYGLESSVSMTPNRYIAVTGGFKVEQKEFYTDPAKDAVNTSLYFSPALIAGPDRTSAFLSASHEGAEEDYNSYDRWVGQLRYDRQLTKFLSLFVAWRHQETRYDGLWYTMQRDDTLNDYGGGTTAGLWQSAGRGITVTLNLKHTYSNQKSTVSLYEYHRNVTAGSLALFF